MSNSSERPRWLFINGSDSFGGHEVMLLRILDELAHQGNVSAALLARDQSLLAERAAVHTLPQHLPARPVQGGPLSKLARIPGDSGTLLKAIETFEPSLCILVDGCLWAQPLMTLICRLSRVPFVIYMPLAEPTRALGFRSGPLRDGLARLGAVNVPKAWVLLTTAQAELFTQWTGSRRPVFVLPNTVGPEIEALGKLARPRSNQPDVQRLLVLGRLDLHQKGLDLLLTFLEQPACALDRLKITLMGDGPAADAISERLARTPALRAMVSMRPWADSRRAFLEHDVLLLPSRFEGVPLVMLEAMALSVPVIATDLPGTRPFLPESCLFSCGDLAKAFSAVEALRAPHVQREVIDHNRASFLRHASMQSFSDAVARLTQDLCRLTQPNSQDAGSPSRATALGNNRGVRATAR